MRTVRVGHLRRFQWAVKPLDGQPDAEHEARASWVWSCQCRIRIRAREDGVPVCKIDAALKTRFYFTRNWNRQKQANLRAVAKAISAASS